MSVFFPTVNSTGSRRRSVSPTLAPLMANLSSHVCALAPEHQRLFLKRNKSSFVIIYGVNKTFGTYFPLICASLAFAHRLKTFCTSGSSGESDTVLPCRPLGGGGLGAA